MFQCNRRNMYRWISFFSVRNSPCGSPTNSRPLKSWVGFPSRLSQEGSGSLFESKVQLKILSSRHFQIRGFLQKILEKGENAGLVCREMIFIRTLGLIRSYSCRELVCLVSCSVACVRTFPDKGEGNL